MEKNINSGKPADARIVQAVRKLKSSKIIEQKVEIRKNQEDTKQSKNILNKPVLITNTINEQKTKALTPITQKNKNNSGNNIINVKNSNENISKSNNQNKNNIFKREISKSSSKNKISIDGSIVKPNTSSTTNKSINKTFDYETLKKYKKRQKSDYQKNLLSKKNIDKCKEECVNLIKKETEIKNLLSQIGISKDDDYLLYITNNFLLNLIFYFH